MRVVSEAVDCSCADRCSITTRRQPSLRVRCTTKHYNPQGETTEAARQSVNLNAAQADVNVCAAPCNRQVSIYF